MIVSEFITTTSAVLPPARAAAVGARRSCRFSQSAPGIVIPEHAEALPFSHEGHDVLGCTPGLQAERVAAEVNHLAAIGRAREMELGAAPSGGIGCIARASGLEREFTLHAGRTG